MRSFSSNKSSRKGLNSRQHEDRITNLPSCLITKILSCLPTKEAVATSVLSTKWKRSWINVPNLDFDDELTYPYDKDRDATISRNLTNFVNRVLQLRGKSFLQRFRLKCYRVCDDSLVNAWIMDILQCNVQELDIFIYLNPCVLPSEIFLCSTLVILKLKVRISYVTLPTSALPNLRTLHLTRILLPSDESIKSLFSGCPVLEELSLCECIGKDVLVVNISTRVLKRLIIKDLPYGNEDETGFDYQLVIDTPSLENLDIADCSSTVYVVNKLDNLIGATIDISDHGIYEDELREKISGDVKNLLNRVFQVENLTLTSHTMEVISWCNPALPKFSNLTCLTLHAADDTRWIVLSKLIENSPCLETLYIIQGDEYDIDEDVDTFPFHDVPCSFHSHLKNIEIENFRCSENEIKMVEYFLKNANVLEKLTLRCETLDEEASKVRELVITDLLSFSRASAICKVKVHSLIEIQ